MDGNVGVLRCVECSSDGNRAKTTRVWLGFSQERWMCCSKFLSRDRRYVCTRCVNSPCLEEVGARCMVLECNRLHAPYERSTPIKSQLPSWFPTAPQPPKPSRSSQKFLPRGPSHVEICCAAVMLSAINHLRSVTGIPRVTQLKKTDRIRPLRFLNLVPES